MCDKAEFHRLRDRVEKLERDDAVTVEKIKTMVRWQWVQFWTISCAFFLCLLALIFGAIGPKGFNAVAEAAPKIAMPK